MNRVIQVLNFSGIFALAALSCAQWKNDSRLQLSRDALERLSQAQSGEITTQLKTLKENADDMENLRSRLSLADSDLVDSRRALAYTTTQRDGAIAERNQVRKAMDLWIAAVKARDAALKTETDRLIEVTNDRNDAVKRYNDLVAKYNALVKSESGG